MEDYTIRIADKNPKAVALINYLKTLDFIEITKSTDWWSELTKNDRDSIERGLDDLKSGRIHTDDDVRKRTRERILAAGKK